MKIERTIKFTLNKEDQRAVNAVLDIANEIFDKMTADDVLAVSGEEYDRDCLDMVKCFLADLWQNGDGVCEIVEN